MQCEVPIHASQQVNGDIPSTASGRLKFLKWYLEKSAGCSDDMVEQWFIVKLVLMPVKTIEASVEICLSLSNCSITRRSAGSNSHITDEFVRIGSSSIECRKKDLWSRAFGNVVANDDETPRNSMKKPSNPMSYDCKNHSISTGSTLRACMNPTDRTINR